MWITPVSKYDLNYKVETKSVIRKERVAKAPKSNLGNFNEPHENQEMVKMLSELNRKKQSSTPNKDLEKYFGGRLGKTTIDIKV